jgi:hypothetical protein
VYRTDGQLFHPEEINIRKEDVGNSDVRPLHSQEGDD